VKVCLTAVRQTRRTIRAVGGDERGKIGSVERIGIMDHGITIPQRPACKKCGAILTGPIRFHHTTCPECGKRWRLNVEHTAIYTDTLEVHDVTHEENVPTIGEGTNG
jgi:predicted RNA-binding Zn-ribbon protein involved in translation (DUF1610 family)